MEFLTTYWSQITVLIGAIGAPIVYFLKRYYDLKDKAAELKRTLFQNEKVKAITDFLMIYGELETFYQTSVSPNVDSGHVSKHNFDNVFGRIMEKFRASYNVLFVYLDETEMAPFVELFKSQVPVHNGVTEFFASYKSRVDFANHGLSEWLSKHKQNISAGREIAERLFKQIGINYRSEYK